MHVQRVQYWPADLLQLVATLSRVVFSLDQPGAQCFNAAYQQSAFLTKILQPAAIGVAFVGVMLFSFQEYKGRQSGTSKPLLGIVEPRFKMPDLVHAVTVCLFVLATPPLVAHFDSSPLSVIAMFALLLSTIVLGVKQVRLNTSLFDNLPVTSLFSRLQRIVMIYGDCIAVPAVTVLVSVFGRDDQDITGLLLLAFLIATIALLGVGSVTTQLVQPRKRVCKAILIAVVTAYVALGVTSVLWMRYWPEELHTIIGLWGGWLAVSVAYFVLDVLPFGKTAVVARDTAADGYESIDDDGHGDAMQLIAKKAPHELVVVKTP